MPTEDLAGQASQDVSNFMQAYVELLEELQQVYKPEDNLVESMRREVQFRVNMGAELAEALSEHYEHMRRKYDLQPSGTSGSDQG